ncbi:hypothetical protein FB446DRAFT_368173 [Lentinula raphanica]|nr:hypothetical protein FB446DRAFT_368173 [Lentinula raphanica]
MTRFTPNRLLALLLLGAATVSSGVLAAPTSSMNSGLSSTGVAEPQSPQSRTSPEQGSLSDVQRQGVEHANLVPPAGEGTSTSPPFCVIMVTDPEGLNVSSITSSTFIYLLISLSLSTLSNSSVKCLKKNMTFLKDSVID